MSKHRLIDLFLIFTLLGPQPALARLECLNLAEELNPPPRLSEVIATVDSEAAGTISSLKKETSLRDLWEDTRDYHESLQKLADSAFLDEVTQDLEKDTQLEASLIRLLSKMAKDPDPRIRSRELDLLKAHPRYVRLLKVASLAGRIQRLAGQWLNNIKLFLEGRPRVFSVSEEKGFPDGVLVPQNEDLGFTEKAKNFLKSAMDDQIVSLFHPFPAFFKTPVSKIFTKLWRNPSYRITPEEKETLQKYGDIERYEEKQAFMNKHPRWTGFRKWLGYTASVAVLLSGATLVNHSVHLAENSMDRETYLSDSAHKLQNNQINIFDDIGPLPHMAIQIGNTVYSYGVDTMTATPARQYFMQRETLQAQTGQKGNQTVDNLTPRSIQVATINLNQNEVDTLRRDLEMQSFKKYKNVTTVNDCATMAIRALKRDTSFSIPHLVDASPGQVMMYLSAMRTTEVVGASQNPRVAQIGQVIIDGHHSTAFHVTRNIWMDSVESRLFIDSLLIREGHRGYITATTDEGSLSWWSPETQLAFQKIRTDIENEIDEDPIILNMDHQIDQALRQGDGSRIQKIRGSVNYYFQGTIQRTSALANSPQADFWSFFDNSYRTQRLKLKYDQMTQKLALATPH